MTGATLHATLPLVLLVDDEPLLLRAFERMVRMLPVRLVSVSTAEAGLEQIAHDGAPALVISDYQLPGMDGVTFLMGVRARHPHVRLVLSTGTTCAAPAGSGITLLPKPVEIEALIKLFESLGPR